MDESRDPKFLKPSTLAMWRAGRDARDYSWLDFLHGYIYGRWTYLYIGIGIGEHPVSKALSPLLAGINKLLKPSNINEDEHLEAETKENKKTSADTYHGKVVTLDAARELVTVTTPVDLTGLEQIIPYEHATDIILRNPDHIVALECPCRKSRTNPCTPLDVCLVIGEPFTSFVMDHHKSTARWISQDEAVEILHAEDERGHAHHAFFKDAMLGRFYAICNCCSCCCGAIQAHNNNTPMLASSGYVCHVAEVQCIGCETCVSYCQFGALKSENGYIAVDHEACMGCGVCIDKCNQEALMLVLDETKGIPLNIRELMESAVQSEQINLE
jgi:Pyruvate/2-oxoacid:ferredoxin oxidoreductase delta subunit